MECISRLSISTSKAHHHTAIESTLTHRIECSRLRSVERSSGSTQPTLWPSRPRRLERSRRRESSAPSLVFCQGGVLLSHRQGSPQDRWHFKGRRGAD